ncbi:hypothetical protein CCAX7_30450 [Capsulimonas corticalis]|uniref:Uncharacterized protein n=1 Tax=Capsulimonas corticalis TaxID=2219043 RepID=A0A402CSQ4_9BACT|nr:hypothetical protein [Capsulimonas corticalis]BDI30994.1 hypothetical protein CCAX7_30450 [Capsulimonas corticalis]
MKHSYQSALIFAGVAVLTAFGHVAGAAGKDAAAPAVIPTASAEAIASAAANGKYLLTERTPVHMVLDEQLKSGDSKVGQDVAFHTDQDIYNAEHILLIPANSQAFGQVTQSSRPGAWGKAGKLNFTCDYILLPDRSKVALRSSTNSVHGKDNSAALVGGILAFGIFGGFVKGRDVTIHKGDAFTMYVNADTQLPALTAGGAPAAAPAASGRTLFTLNNGNQIAGTLLSLDNGVYTVNTDAGKQTVKASDVKTMFALAN